MQRGKMEFVPIAMGQSDHTLVIWGDYPEIAQTLHSGPEMVSEVKWGIGALEQDPCLILYLFRAEDTLEIYLPETLPTSPDLSIDVWTTFLDWNPEVMKLRYGVTPADKSKEITFLLPKSAGETAVVKLQDFLNQTSKNSQAMPASYQELLVKLKNTISTEGATQ